MYVVFITKPDEIASVLADRMVGLPKDLLVDKIRDIEQRWTDFADEGPDYTEFTVHGPDGTQLAHSVVSGY